MKHYLININWECQLHCSYCWVRKHVNKIPDLDTMQVRPLEDWIRAIERDTPDVLDIGGGEPLLVEWCLDLIRAFPKLPFGLSTNGLCQDKIDELVRNRIGNIININLSYHPEALRKDADYDMRWRRQVRMLTARGYTVHSNLEATDWNMEHSIEAREWLRDMGKHMVISPVCGGREESKHLQEQGLVCKGGVNHITVTPDGSAWPCLNALWSYQWRETCLGNWLDGALDLGKKPVPCHLYCSDYVQLYHEHEGGDFWHSEVKPYIKGA